MASDRDEQQVRLTKLEGIKQMGIHPYPEKYDKQDSLEQSKKKEPGETVQTAGRLMLLRDMGKIIFAHLKDQSGRIQIAFREDVLGKEKMKFVLKFLDLGDFIGVAGEIFLTKTGEKTILVKDFTFLGKNLRPLPEKYHGLQDQELKYRQRYLDTLMDEDTMKRFMFRSRFIQVLRHFYEQEGFVEVETNILGNSASGALAKPFQTHHNALDLDVYLRIAPEVSLKKLIIGGFDKVFEVAKIFRNEGMDPSHLQEITEVEHYAAYWNYEDNMRFTEKMFQYLLSNLLGTLKISIPDREGNLVEVDFSAPWPTVSFRELLLKDAGIDIDLVTTTENLRQEIRKKKIEIEDMDKLGYGNLIDALYKKVSRPKLTGPVFLTEHPIELSPLARKNDQNPNRVDRFQLVVVGWEIVNAYSELVDPVDQKQRFEDQASAKEKGDEEAHGKDDDYVKAMEYGMPPISGWGMGIDRILALLTAQSNLRDVVLFPLLRPEEETFSKKEQEKVYASKRVVVIADESQDPGVVANAVGQLGISIGGHSHTKLFETKVLHDADGQVHYTDCLYPMVNFAGSQKEMAAFAQMCYEASIQFHDFSDIMRKAHRDDQMQAGYKAKKTKDIGYIAVGALVPNEFAKDFLAKLKLFGQGVGVSKPLNTKQEIDTDEQSSLPPSGEGTTASSEEKISIGTTKDDALKLIEKVASSDITSKHLLSVGAAMKHLCTVYGDERNIDAWEIAGLLHDIDWDITNQDPTKHCSEETGQLLRDRGLSEEMITIIRSHYEATGIPRTKLIQKALFAVDELCGLIVAVAIMRPSKSLNDLETKSVLKKFKDKSFAAKIRRDWILTCETELNTPIEKFIEHTIAGLRPVGQEIGLR